MCYALTFSYVLAFCSYDMKSLTVAKRGACTFALPRPPDPLLKLKKIWSVMGACRLPPPPFNPPLQIVKIKKGLCNHVGGEYD